MQCAVLTCAIIKYNLYCELNSQIAQWLTRPVAK